jgi:hypothetical protein
LRDLDRRAHDRIDLQRLAGFDVKKHRGLVVADPLRARQPTLERDLRLAVKCPSDRECLLHHGDDEPPAVRTTGNLGHGRARECTDRVERDVAHQLEPDIATQVGLHRALEAAGDHRRAEVRASSGE